ncbi:actin-related protein 5-like [Mantella aurantiaca]
MTDDNRSNVSVKSPGMAVSLRSEDAAACHLCQWCGRYGYRGSVTWISVNGECCQCIPAQELLEDGQVDQFHKALVELNMDSAEELQSYIHKLNAAVEQDGKPQTPEALGGEQEDMEGIIESDSLYSEDQVEAEKTAPSVHAMFNIAEYHQMYLGTERICMPEVLFQPSQIGKDQAGLAETMQHILDWYPQEVQQQLAQNVFLTGGKVMYPGIQTRMEKELLMMRPFGSTFHVSMAANPVLDAWHGASDWALQNLETDEGWISRKEYEEMGGEYLKEHVASNRHTAIRLPKLAPRTAMVPSRQETEGIPPTSSAIALP